MPPKPKGKMMLIDTSRCMACRGCQVACKDWHQLPAEETTFTGTYENPPDLSGITLSRVRFSEVDGPVFKWLFFKDQCRHCMKPKCQQFCPVSNAIEVAAGGAVVITASCDPASCADGQKPRPCEKQCPYGIPRFNGEKETKCDFCFDRIEDGKSPICAKTCPPGAITFGDPTTVIDEANARMAELPGAQIYPDSFTSSKPGAGTRVGWILVDDPSAYGIET